MKLNDFEVKLKNLSKINLNLPLEKACLLVENAAKENAPVSTGNLRRSITHEINGNEGIIGTNVEYAPYVEFGTGLFATDGNGRDTPWKYQTADGQWYTTKGQKPQPFLGPALELNKDKILDIFIQAIQEELKK